MPTLLHGDCLELMKTLPDKSVDCFVCDLPYGCLSIDGKPKVSASHMEQYGKGRLQGGSCPWDVKINLELFWIQVKRLAKDAHTPVLMFCTTKFGVDLINSNPSWFRYDLVWDKERGVSFLLANKMPMKSHEMVYVFSKAGAHYTRKDTDSRCALSVLKVAGKSVGGHPTQKPEDLYRWLLERYCPAGGTVLDPTAGSFNAIKVAEELGLKGIGMEKDDAFFAKAQARFGPDVSGDSITHVI